MNVRLNAWGFAALLLTSCGGVSPIGLGDGGADASADARSIQVSLRNSLAGAWTFDSDGADHSGNHLDLDTGGLRFGAGRFGKGVVFGGDGTPIAQRPIDDASLNLATGEFTVSFWIDFASTSSAQFVAVKGYNEGGWFVGWAKTAWAYALPAPSGGATFTPAGGSPVTGMFHHVVFERSGDSAEIFVDGKSVGKNTVADAAAPMPAPFQVGGFSPGGATAARGMSVVDGTVDDLAIWHRALLPEERDYLATHAVP